MKAVLNSGQNHTSHQLRPLNLPVTNPVSFAKPLCSFYMFILLIFTGETPFRFASPIVCKRLTTTTNARQVRLSTSFRVFR